MHTGNYSEDPTQWLQSSQQRDCAHAVFRVLLTRFAGYLQAVTPPERVAFINNALSLDHPGKLGADNAQAIVSMESLERIITWLRYMGSFSEAFLHIVRQEFVTATVPARNITTGPPPTEKSKNETVLKSVLDASVILKGNDMMEESELHLLYYIILEMHC